MQHLWKARMFKSFLCKIRLVVDVRTRKMHSTLIDRADEQQNLLHFRLPCEALIVFFLCFFFFRKRVCYARVCGQTLWCQTNKKKRPEQYVREKGEHKKRETQRNERCETMQRGRDSMGVHSRPFANRAASKKKKGKIQRDGHQRKASRPGGPSQSRRERFLSQTKPPLYLE